MVKQTVQGLERKKKDVARRRTIAYALMAKKKSLKLSKSASISQKVAQEINSIQKEENCEEFWEKGKDPRLQR